ncbi:MAG: phosphotransferase [Clostridia bacterium]|nr:phosphotransferase [Clostridia bacterium]
MSDLVRGALAAFGLTGAEAAFLQHNENLTFRVDGKYLLRIHKAAEGIHADHNPNTHRAELAFLRHLADKGMPVQRPMAQAILPDGTMATLLTWLEGHSLHKEDLTPEFLFQAGTLVFRLHQASEGFHHASLRRYGDAHIHQLSAALQAMGQRYQLDSGEIAAAIKAAQVISSRLQAASGALIPIHADLSPSNLLLTPDGPAPIDFSLLGLGHPMHDLGILMGNISSQAQRQAVAEGYISAGGRIDLPLLDAGLALGLLEALVFHADTWPKEPWFAPRLTRWADEMLRPLATGKPLLDETMYLVNLK